MNIIKNINWKARIKNPVFWATIVPAAVSFVYCLLGAFGITPALTESMVLNIVSTVITALTTIGVLVDPTTAGVCDSKRALTYEAPKKDGESEEGAAE